MPVKDVGDAATAFVIKLEFGDATHVVDWEWHMVLMRFVRTLGSISYGLSPNFIQTDADAITKIVADRLQSADGLLPEQPHQQLHARRRRLTPLARAAGCAPPALHDT